MVCEELTHLKRPCCWERLRAGGEGDYRGWDCWMASPTQLTWVWVDSRSWWWTGRPGCDSWGCKKSDMTEWLNWTELNWCKELTHCKRPWCWERLQARGKGTTEDEMARCHHRLDGHEFEWTPGVGDGQGGLECCDSWGCKESDTTERLNWIELNWWYICWCH